MKPEQKMALTCGTIGIALIVGYYLLLTPPVKTSIPLHWISAFLGGYCSWYTYRKSLEREPLSRAAKSIGYGGGVAVAIYVISLITILSVVGT